MATRRKKSGHWSALGSMKREAESVEHSQTELQRALDAVDPAVAKARALLRPTWSRPAKDALIEAFNPLQEAIKNGLLTAKTSGRKLLELPAYYDSEHIHNKARALAARHNELLIHADDVKIALSRALHGDSIAVERALDHFGVTAQRRIGTVTESTKENMMARKKKIDFNDQDAVLQDPCQRGRESTMKRHFQVSEGGRKVAARDPEIKEIGHIGDVNWPEYGGGPIFRRGSDDSDCFLEYVEPPQGDFDDSDARWTIYSVELDPGVPSWGDLKKVSQTTSESPKDLRAAFESPDPIQRAWAYEAWAAHYGWGEFDQYARQYTCAEMNERYPDADIDCGDDNDDRLEEARSRRTMRENGSVDDPDYIIQGLYDDGKLATGEFGFDNEDTAVYEAKKLARSNWFDGDYVRVITRDGELVWDSLD